MVCKHLHKLGISELNEKATVAKALGDASWFTKLPNAFLEHIDTNSQRNFNAPSTSYIHTVKTYDGTLLSDLIEVIRNNEEHYQKTSRWGTHILSENVPQFIYGGIQFRLWRRMQGKGRVQRILQRNRTL